MVFAGGRMAGGGTVRGVDHALLHPRLFGALAAHRNGPPGRGAVALLLPRSAFLLASAARTSWMAASGVKRSGDGHQPLVGRTGEHPADASLDRRLLCYLHGDRPEGIEVRALLGSCFC